MRKLLASTALLLLEPRRPAATIEVNDQARGATTIAYPPPAW